ncbi:hypothetical protein HF086_007984 [Spodoptera exigua]|uniref:HEAT repeat-containing protein 6 n=1 Tax=Spodoptera exigua TaxID=7107 RepID=A0A922SPE6_SPOEX|nr:hypothetical protein HF086_007984 [Spodoptera exigua]
MNNTHHSLSFSLISGELCNLLYLKEYNKEIVNKLIDDLNAKPYKAEIFVRKHDAATVVTALCLNVKPVDEFLAAKTSHLINSLITKQNLEFETDYLWKVISWHIECLKYCTDIVLPDILHSLQCIIELKPQATHKFIKDLIGVQGVLIRLIDSSKYFPKSQNSLQNIHLMALKCICCVMSTVDEKQKIRKQRNNAMESLKKEIPVSDRSLMKDVDNFDNNSAYKPAAQHYLEPQKAKSYWALTSDSDMSDVENSKEVKLIALRSRVRQSASNLLLVLIKVTETRDIFGYWWALLPDSPDPANWSAGESAKKTLAYCAVTDPIASSRSSVLKKESSSFIPFSESLGYMIVCLHKVLTNILESERTHAVIIVALKCCAALVQATPYHKMKEGLITQLVMATRKFLVHRAVTLQVGALITMGCVLSVDPKIDEVLKAIEKDTVPSKISTSMSSTKITFTTHKVDAEECDDFEEGYSDDEMFTAAEPLVQSGDDKVEGYYFRTWILDICCKNMGWVLKGNEIMRRLQVLCCTLLIGSCSDEEPTVRAAAVRALAMLVMYRTLREDICFVSDCGENVLRALAEPTTVVRIKAAWALGNLCDALVLNLEDPECDDIDDTLLIRLLEVSIQCATDNDKVKMSATRGLGNLLRLIKNENLVRNTQLRTLCETAIGKLMDCACKVNNMKNQVFSSLCSLTRECKNLKVRINAAAALRAPSARAQYAEHYALVWRGVLAAMENAADVDDFNEYKHKDNLIEQLCVTLAHLCCLLTQADLADILDPLVFHYENAKATFTQVCHKLPPENASCLKILQAAKYVTVDLTASNDTQMQALSMLQDIFIWDM